MKELIKGRYRAALAQTTAEISAAQALRLRAFGLSDPTGRDHDRFDALCDHMIVHDLGRDRMVCCFRLMPLVDGGAIDDSYSAQFYDLTALHDFRGKMVEIGRFCIDPDISDPDILRAAWAAMTAYVDARGIELLFGCSSFHGVDETKYLDSFAMLRDRHAAPRQWLPRVKAPHVFDYATRVQHKPDMVTAMKALPPLLRTYLMMGGWVSDHAVIDHQMNTMHVFTGVEIAAIPPARQRLLRALA